jgi:endonuclease/exonuclease/phosphatase family metal-dependent hydrolase
VDATARVDLQRLWVAHGPRHLFLRVQLDTVFSLSADNSLALHLDTDDDPSTGRAVHGLGAEVTWAFGRRTGIVAADGRTVEVGHDALGISYLPTVWARTFEVALDRSARPAGHPLFRGGRLRMALTLDGDRLPDAEGGLGYRLSATPVERSVPRLRAPASGSLRLLSYNVRRDGLFKSATQAAFGRILRAVDADVIGFQEVYEHSATATGRVVDSLMAVGAASGAEGPESGDEWAVAKAGPDLVVASRHPVLDVHAIPGYEDYESGAFLLDTREALGRRLVLVVMHPPCCNVGPEDGAPSRNVQRQLIVDGVAAFLRDLRAGTGPLDVPENTPIAVLGDMNFVGDPQQARTLRTGDIVNEGRFGPAAAPDWDGSPLLDVNPGQTERPMHTTWIDAESPFPPGRLDYIYFSDSVVRATHAFVLHTPALADSTLAAYGLRANDTRIASDHLPLVVDIARR